MNNLTIAVQTIKSSVSALDVAEAMGWEIRRGRCKCPIHGGNDFNCVMYKGDRGFYCHVCKAGGDVIRLIQECNGIGFREAVGWLNSTFCLGMDINSPMSPEAIRAAEEARRKRDADRRFREGLERARFDLALAADRLVQRIEEQRDKNVPVRPDQVWNEKFSEAVKILPEARRLAQETMSECIRKKEEER